MSEIKELIGSPFMSAHKIYPVRDNISNTALINKDSYLEMYEASISEPD